MKFANYTLNATSKNYIGDWMQIIAIDNLYLQMGVNLSDVVYLDIKELGTYNGEYVILPISMPLLDYVEGGIANIFSDHIIPVFLGLTMVKDILNPNEVSYLKKYEPIGCRDERTLNTVRKYGIQSFLNGCLTITMSPEIVSRVSGNNRRPYIVDIGDSVLAKIPLNIKEKAVYKSHSVKCAQEDCKELTQKLYQEYKDNASMVITSLLHCALPCIAAGIPVILIKKEPEISYRFSWIEKIVKIYSEKDLPNSVDWNPKPIDIRRIREKVFNLDSNLLWNAYNHWSDMLEVSWFYENRTKHIYINDACESIKSWIDNHWTDYEEEYRYAFWGLTQMSEWLDAYISTKYPHAILSHVYDTYRRVKFRGIEAVNPQTFDIPLDEYVFVTAAGANESAMALFKKMGKSEDRYACV